MKKEIAFVAIAVVFSAIAISYVTYEQAGKNTLTQNQPVATTTVVAPKNTRVSASDTSVSKKEDAGTLDVSLTYCVSDGNGTCATIDPAVGLCEGTDDVSSVNAYSANKIGVVARWNSNAAVHDQQAKGYNIYYTVTATDEYGQTAIVLPRQLSSEVASAPFLEPLSLGFIATLKPLLYHIVVDVETKANPGKAYQTNTQLIVPTPQTLISDPGYCNRITNGSGSGAGI